MRLVVQRVSRAQVTVSARVIGEISRGAVVLVGVTHADTAETAAYMAEKTAHLRIFSDLDNKMNLSLLDIQGMALVISQFTLYGDLSGGRRPSFIRAAPPQAAVEIYGEYVKCLRALGITVETGQFQAHMEVELVNDGPVTILLDSEKLI